MIGYSPKFDSKQNLDGIQIEFTIIRHQILFFFSLYHEDEQVFQISLVIDPQKKEEPIFWRSNFIDPSCNQDHEMQEILHLQNFWT